MKKKIVCIVLTMLVFLFTGNVFAQTTGWKKSMEFSLLTASGNTRSMTSGVKAEAVKTKDKFKFTFKAGYFYGKTEGVETASNWFAKIKEEFSLSGKLYVYDILGVESDKYAGIDYRYNGQVGLGYSIIKTGNDELKSEAGADYTSEKRRSATDKDFIFARYFMGYMHKLSDTSKFDLSADYLYDSRESENWRSNGEAALSMKLRENLSFKTGISYKFLNMPVAGKSKTDVLTSTALILDF